MVEAVSCLANEEFARQLPRELRQKSRWFCCLAGACCSGLLLLLVSSSNGAELDPLVTENAEISGLLERAWRGGTSAAASVESQYEVARESAIQPRRWDHALGVAAIKLRRWSLATRAFEAALQEGGEGDVAAWRGAIWADWRQNQFERALSRLERVAELISDPQGPIPDAERASTAVWIGLVTTALDYTVLPAKLKPRLAIAEARIRQQLPPALLANFEAGHDYVIAEFERLIGEAEASVKTENAKLLTDLQGQLNRVLKGLQESEQQHTQVTQQLDSLRQRADQQSRNLDQQLAVLEREHAALQARTTSLAQSVATLRTQLALLTPIRTGYHGRIVYTGLPVYYPYSAGAQLLNLDADLQYTSARGAMLAQQAFQASLAREQTWQGYEQRSSPLLHRQQALEQVHERLLKRGQQIEQTPLKTATPLSKRLRAQARAVESYVRYDVDWERIRVTERF